jgi:lipoate-protein ligase A
MAKVRAKILRFEDIDVEDIFAKENTLLQAIQNDELDQALLLWQTKTDTLVLPAGNKWQQSDLLIYELNNKGWQLSQRKTGGAPVPQGKGVINVSYLYTLEKETNYSIPDSYNAFCQILAEFFNHFDIKVETHATPNSYCDGDYNLNINGKKVVGTAQRVVLKKAGGKVVLAQACILVDVDTDKLVSPVNLCYQHHKLTERVSANVHTGLFKHTNKKISIKMLYQILIQCFLNQEEVRK